MENTPEKKFTTGAISAAIWTNTGKTKSGQEMGFKSISLQRSYKDKNDEWQHTSSLRLNDLPKATLVLSKAYEYLILKGEEQEEEIVM